MVDLVKIRRKAKKAAAAPEPGPAAPAPATEPAVTPVEPAVTVEPAAIAAAPPAGAVPAGGSVSPGELAQPGEATPAGAPMSKLERFREQAGRLRDAVRADPAAGELLTAADQLEVLSFVIAGEHYAADIERIVEIVTPRAVTRVPNADPAIVGVVSLRGMMVTLIDIRSRLRHRASPQTADTRIIVVDHQGETLGFEVDRVLRVLKLGRGSVEPHPVVHASEGDESIIGVFRQEGALTILLDFDKLLAMTAARA